MHDQSSLTISWRVLLVSTVVGIVWAAAVGGDYRVYVFEPAVTDHLILTDGRGPLPPVCKEATNIGVAYVPGSPPEPHMRRFDFVSEEQYRLEVRNMLAHGLSNPTVAQYIGWIGNYPEGSMDLSALEKVLDVRESEGMRPKALYLLGNPYLRWHEGPLTAEQREQNRQYVSQVVAWAKRRGYEAADAMSNGVPHHPRRARHFALGRISRGRG